MPKLYKHQLDLLNLNPQRWGIFWGCGTGKTAVAIRLAENNSKNCLVVCPKSLVKTWQDEIDKWGEKKEMSWHILSKETFRRDWSKIPKFDCVVFDEVHFFSGYTSQMHKNAVLYLAKHNPKFIYGLTGTPYLSSAFNIYSLERLLGHKPDWYWYRTTFFYNVLIGTRTVPMQRSGMEKYLISIIKRIGSTVKLEDCVDVPDQIFQTEYFDLTIEQRKAIDSLIDIAPIARWTKIHQICGGSLKGNQYEDDKYFVSEKLERIKELVKEYPKLIIVCRYNAEIEYLERVLKEEKYCVYSITGKTIDRYSIIKSAEGYHNCIVIINACCCEGYGLPSFPIMIFYSYDFSLKNYIQIIGRIQRINNIKKNIYLSLVVKDTIDEDVYKCIMKKQDFDIELYDKEKKRGRVSDKV